MIEFFQQNMNHFMFVMLLISRLGDVVSTLLATPRLKLEANVIARKLGKPFVFLTLLIAFIAYYDVALAVAVLIPSLLVSSGNLGKVWVMRKLGEDGYQALLAGLVRKHGVKGQILFNALSACFIALVGAVLLVLAPDPRDGGFWAAVGFFIYAFALVFWGTINSLTLRRKLSKGGDAREARDDSGPRRVSE
jgi:hypothetical protein